MNACYCSTARCVRCGLNYRPKWRAFSKVRCSIEIEGSFNYIYYSPGHLDNSYSLPLCNYVYCNYREDENRMNVVKKLCVH